MNLGSYYIFRPGWPLVADPRAWEHALDWASECGCDAVLAFTTDACGPPHPPLDDVWLRARLLAERFERVRALGMTPMVNVYVTLGHGSASPADHASGWASLTDARGHGVPGCPCPLDAGFLRYIKDAYAAWGSVGAESVWVDDDFRLTGRDGCSTPQCFCDLHMREYSKLTGRQWDRSEVVRLLTEGEGEATQDYRAMWYELLGKSLDQVLRVVTEAVKTASPTSSMGLMVAFPEWNDIAGRRMDHEIKTLTMPGRPSPWIRTGGGAYRDERPLDILEKVIRVADPYLTLTQPCRLCCEIENYPWVPGIKSAKVLSLEMYLNTISTNGLLTLSLHDSFLEQHDPAGTIAPMMKGIKPYLDEVSLSIRGKLRRGASMLIPENYRLSAVSPEHDLYAMGLARSWNLVMARIGIPQAPCDGRPAILTGQSPKAIKRDDLARILAQGAILDAEAMEHVINAGLVPMDAWPVSVRHSKLEGKMATERISAVGCPERYFGRDLPTRWHTRYDASRSIEVDSSGAEVWSRIYDVDGREVACGVVTMSEPYPLCIIAYASHQLKETGRQWLLQVALARVANGQVPGMVEGLLEVYPVWWYGEDSQILGLCNFGEETWPSISLWLPNRSQKPAKVLRLDRDGTWRCVGVETSWEEHPLGGLRVLLADADVPAALSFETYKFED